MYDNKVIIRGLSEIIWMPSGVAAYYTVTVSNPRTTLHTSQGDEEDNIHTTISLYGPNLTGGNENTHYLAVFTAKGSSYNVSEIS